MYRNISCNINILKNSHNSNKVYWFKKNSNKMAIKKKNVNTPRPPKNPR